MKQPVILSWSGGKDSAAALHALRHSTDWEVAGLLTTLTRPFDRVSMHGVRRALLEEQARSLALPLHTVEIPEGAGNAEYESAMRDAFLCRRTEGIRVVAFGDLFLRDLKEYREAQVERLGMDALFPLWNRDTAELARAFSRQGFRAVVTCVDGEVLGREWAGRSYDAAFLRDLPPHVDPCGENGEFHTFVYDGPPFRHPVQHQRGETVLRDGRFFFCDLLPPSGD